MCRVWSSEGITTNVLSDGRVECTTDHLTTFAVLFTTAKREKTDIETMILRVLSYSLLSISLIFLFTSLVIYLVAWKKFFKSDITDISVQYFNHALVLFLALACFTFGIETTSSVYWLCTGIAFLLHFLWTNVFMASLCIGIVCLYKVVLININAKKKLSSYLVPISWSVSFLWALAWFIYTRFEGEYLQEDTMSVNETKLVSFERSCFLSMTGNIIWAFIAPIVLIIGINLVILFMTMIKLKKVKMDSRNKTEFQTLRQGVLGGLLLVPVLSLPFIVALPLMFSRFYQGDSYDLIIQIFEWIFIIVNAPIGIYHFFTITMQRRDVIEFLRELIKHGGNPETSMINYSNPKTRDNAPPLVLRVNRKQPGNNSSTTNYDSNREPVDSEEIEGVYSNDYNTGVSFDSSSSEHETRF